MILVSASNDIVVTPSLITNGIYLETEKGNEAFGADHGALHEFAHAMVNTIMTEMGGKFNDIDFKTMTKTQRSDWAIQYTNTLLESMKKPLETGKGQHGRGQEELPASKLDPLKK